MEKEEFPCPFGNGDRPDHKSPQAALLSAVFRYMGPLSGTDAAVCQFCVLHECQRGVLCEAADERLRSFSISMGLTVSSVVGTVLANLVGGRLCDMFHPGILILVSSGIPEFSCIFCRTVIPQYGKTWLKNCKNYITVHVVCIF